MDDLKAYQWEREKWPWHRRMMIRYDLRRHLTFELARFFEVKLLGVQLDGRNGGGRAWSHTIRLGGPSVRCCLGTILHEIAHVVDAQKYGGRGHTGSFRRALIRVYCEANRAELKKMILAAAAKSKEDAAVFQRSRDKAMRESRRREEAKRRRQGPEYRLELARARVKRLQTRAKRIATLLKSAERSLRARERSSGRAVNGCQCLGFTGTHYANICPFKTKTAEAAP